MNRSANGTLFPTNGVDMPLRQAHHCSVPTDQGTAMTTKHNHPMVFGRRHEGCPRCEELNAGAKPIQWAGSQRRQDEAAKLAAIRAHDCVASRCGVVCTANEW